MTISITHFQQKDIYKGTWRTPNGEVTNQIDHFLIETQHAKQIKNVQSYRGADADSDHYLLRIKLKQEVPKRQVTKEKTYQNEVAQLQEENTQEKYKKMIENKLGSSKQTDG